MVSDYIAVDSPALFRLHSLASRQKYFPIPDPEPLVIGVLESLTPECSVVESIQDLLRSAREMEVAGEFDGAIEVYQEILEREPKHAIALLALGLVMNHCEDYERAEELLEQAVAIYPNDPTRHVALGESYRKLGEYRNSVGCCHTALRLRPDYPEGLIALGLALRDSGDLREAVEQFRRALSIQPDFTQAHTNLGLALRELGESGEAIKHLRRAVELLPDSPMTRTDLGLALLALGQTPEAIDHFQEAVRLRPDLPALHHNLGNSLRVVGRTFEAKTSYLRAIRLDPSLALCYVHIGLTLQLEGSLGEAMRWHEIAVEMEPDNPSFWGDLANLHMKREEWDKAVECGRRVLELTTPAGAADAHLALGWAMQEDGRLDEAMEQYLMARRLQPNSSQVQFALSGVYQEQGDMAEAEAAVRESIRLQPGFPAGYGRLAIMLKRRLPDGDMHIIEGLLSDPRLDRPARSRLLFSIAQVLDSRAEYTRAAACLREANVLALELRSAEGMTYDPEKHNLFVEDLIRAFDSEFFRRTSGMGLETRRPVFVFGLPRSGTTLVEHILASHPCVYGAGERLFARMSLERLPSILGRDVSPMECLPLLEERSLRCVASEHLGKLDALDLGRSDRIVDKLPENFQYLGLIVAMFPNAVFIHCRRDLRDVAVSCWMSDFRTIRWTNDVGHIGGRFREYRRLMEHWAREFPAPIIEVDYEETVSDLEGVARRLLDGCGLEWHPACLDFHRTRRIVRTASLTQVREPIYTRSVGRWRHYENDLADLFAVSSS